MIYGYARISSVEQNLDLQNDSLKKAGCERIFSDVITGTLKKRPELDRLLQEVRSGDKIVVYKLDRLGRSLKHLMSLVEGFHNDGITFESLSEKIDTQTPSGKLMFQVFGAIAEFEKELINERCKAGREAARKRGVSEGRPPKLSPQQVKEIKKMYEDKNIAVGVILNHFNITKSTLYRYVRE